MRFRFISSLLLFGLFAPGVPHGWSQSVADAESEITTANAPVETMLYSFAEDANGAYPVSRVVMGSNGRLYGTTSLAGIAGGTAFEMTRSQSGAWTITAVHDFDVNSEGGYPQAGLVFDRAGHLYGTTSLGGNSFDAGTIFEWFYESGAWQLKVIHRFGVGHDGQNPAGDLTIDAAGNLYGTTPLGGAFGQGTVFELTRSSGGEWTEHILHHFRGNHDGGGPEGSLVFDSAGNLYGATYQGGGATPCPGGCGTVFKLSPTASGKWIETVLYRFQGTTDGSAPRGPLVVDHDGTLYGATNFGGVPSCSGNCGTVFKIDPDGRETVLHNFSQAQTDGNYPLAGLVLGPGHDLYGTTYAGGSFGLGTVFRISKHGKFTLLHSFHGYPQDGAQPEAPVSFDRMGNAYGTTFSGGAGATGTVFAITQ